MNFLILFEKSEKSNNNDKIKSGLGLAKKAGAIIAGTELVIDSVRKKKAVHVFLCSDASAGTTKKICDKAAFYQVPATKLDLTMSDLARCIGLLRQSAAVSLTNKSFLKLFNLSDFIESIESTESTEVHL